LVSRGLRVLGFTKKKLCHNNIRRDPAKREQWWKLPPPEGVLNVPRDLLIDIDETSVVLYTTERGFGHALRGRRAVTLSPSHRGTNYSVILAISCRGVVAWDISNKNSNSDNFRNYLCFCLHPAFGRKRYFPFIFSHFFSVTNLFFELGLYLMMDNLSLARV
jgi:hypothetical protein